MPGDIKIKTHLDQNSHFREQNKTAPEVNIDDEEDLKKWANVLHLSEEELIVAVNTFGPKVKDIRLGLSALQKSKAA